MVRRCLRSFAVVIAGLGAVMFLVAGGTVLATVGLASDGPEPGAAYLAVNLLLSLAAAIVGGALVVRLAREHPLWHVVALGGVMALLSLTGGLEQGGGQPAWYPAGVLGLGLIGVSAGGVWMHRRRGGGSRTVDASGTGAGSRRDGGG